MPYKNKEVAKKYAAEYRKRNKKKQAAYHKEWVKYNDLTTYKHNWYIRTRFQRYGITKQAFEILLEKQQNSCAICRTEFTQDNKPQIDHCHIKKHVRGLLCFNCNAGIGQFKDNPRILYGAILYLEEGV